MNRRVHVEPVEALRFQMVSAICVSNALGTAHAPSVCIRRRKTMKSTACTLTMAAVAMMAAAVTASAQNTMKAEIPFSFQAGGARMQPGTYRIIAGHLGGGSAVVNIRDLDSGKEII